MALQVENFISGRIGNVVYFKRGNTWMARAVSAKVKQTEATRSWSRIFGKASTVSRTMRMLLRDILPASQDKAMQNDFTGAIARCMKLLQAGGMQALWPLPELGELSFNKKTGIRERFRAAFTVSKLSDDLLELYIPAFVPTREIAAPAHTKGVDIHICAASCLLPDGEAQGTAAYLLTVPYNDEPIAAQWIRLALPTTPGSLVLTGMRICYILIDDKLVTKESFTPSGIVDGAFYQGQG